MNNNNNTTRTGLGFLSILTLIFVVGKILNLITWSWWLVFLPVLALPIIIAVVFLIAWLVTAVAWLWHKLHD